MRRNRVDEENAKQFKLETVGLLELSYYVIALLGRCVYAQYTLPLWFGGLYVWLDQKFE